MAIWFILKSIDNLYTLHYYRLVPGSVTFSWSGSHRQQDAIQWIEPRGRYAIPD